MQIWKYTNVHVEKYRCQKRKRVLLYIKNVNIYIKNYKVTSNRNVNKETNTQNKEKYIKITNI